MLFFTHTVYAHSCLKTSVLVVSCVWNALHPHTHVAHSLPSFKPMLQSHILKGASLPHPNCSSALSCSTFFTHFHSTYRFLIQYKMYFIHYFYFLLNFLPSERKLLDVMSFVFRDVSQAIRTVPGLTFNMKLKF